MNEFDFLEEQGVAEGLIQAAADYRKEYGVSEEAKHRLMKPSLPFYGKETLEMGMAAGRGESSSCRPQGNWEKCAGRESGIYFRTSGV